MINFCYDSLGEYGIGYPNLARSDLKPWEFDNEWPRVVPWRVLMYLRDAKIPMGVFLVEDAPLESWYPVALSWFDFDCDYFSLMSPRVKTRLVSGDLRVLFSYHEGDNPFTIKHRLDQLCKQNNLPITCYHFLSANTIADQIPGFSYFPDHEYFFRYLNRDQTVAEFDARLRPYRFTALNRTHKWWRATVMADLWRQDLLKNSLWSYNIGCGIDDRPEDNPIQIDAFPGLKNAIETFLKNGPYFCDGNDDQMHNNHHSVNIDLYLQSYCHLVIETFFDADGSGGSFITEKTYKAIKFGQPFIMIGPPKSLCALRKQGYKTFDHMIDNSYDEIIDNTKRWVAVQDVIKKISCLDIHEWFLACESDIRHNQQQFLENTNQGLYDLLSRLKGRFNRQE